MRIRSAEGGTCALVPALPPGHLPRARLTEQLDAVADASLIILHAPSGSGKTTLASEWLLGRDSEEPVVWLTLDRSFTADRDAGMMALSTRVGVVTAEDLAFTADEIAQLAASGPTDGGAADDASTVRDLTEGHPFLTRLTLSTHPRPTAATIGRMATDWVSTLVQPDLLGPTLRLSLLPAADDRLAAAVTDDEGDVLTALTDDGLGARDIDGWFRFHEGVAAALRMQAESSLSADEWSRIRSIAVADLLRRPTDSPIAAFQMLSEAGRVEDLWPHFASSFEDQVPAEIELALDTISPARLENSPMSATLVAVVQSGREATPSVGLLAMVSRALEEIERRPVPDDVVAATFRELAILALHWSARHYEAVGPGISRLLDLVSTLPPGSVALPAGDWGLLYAAVMHALAFELDQAEWLLDELEGDRDPQRGRRRVVLRAFVHAMRGEVDRAELTLAEVDETFAGSPQWRARLEIARASCELEDGHPHQARQRLRRLEPDMRQTLEWAYLIIVAARAHVATDPSAGLEDIDRLLQAQRNRPIAPLLKDMLDSAVADLALAAGDFARARDLAARRGPDDVALRLSAARIALVRPDRGVVDDLRDLTQRDGLGTRLRAQALVLLAVHEHRLGGSEAARQALVRALTITTNHRIRLIQVLIPRGELEEIAAAAGIELPRNVNDADPLGTSLTPVELTAREAVLLQHLATRARLKDIAATEFVALSTIKSQAASLYRKLGVRSRRAALAAAKQKGLLDSLVAEGSTSA